ncbi:MAG: group II intron reverse transcriptase/maturase [Actinobacteria bacterium]|nr:group II intron reverse transcriptase/maturase [Actinomycetota bacterium]
MNAGAPWPDPKVARERVLGIQRKLHKWASDDQDRRFNDLHNLVCDPAMLMVAWQRVRSNRGSRSAGVDGQTARHVEQVLGVEKFLAGLRQELRSQSFRPLPVKERMIPKRGGKLRRLGVPTLRDRVVQAALKTVLEPIFEAQFQPCSYGFRPGRRAHDAIAEIHMLATNSYESVLEADIEACFDSLSHSAILDRVRARIADKRVMALVKAFLKAGIMTELGDLENTVAGTPQGGILSPLMSNIALSVLDEHFARAWQAMGDRGLREAIRRRGGATYRLVRYADDFVVCVAGGRDHAEALVGEVEQVIAPLGLRLSQEKTRVVSIDEGFDFLGFAIKRVRGRHSRRVIHTYPSKRSLQAVKAKVRQITRHTGPDQAPDQLLHRVNAVLRGWCAYFRHGVSSRTFAYLRHYAYWRVVGWLRRKHRKRNWRWLRRTYLKERWPSHAGVELFNPAAVRIERYRYRGAQIPTPWEQGVIAYRDHATAMEHLEGLIAR